MDFVFYINPVPASRPRVSKYGTYYLPTYRNFQKEIAELVAKDRKKLRKTSGELEVNVICAVARPKTTKRDYPLGDVDNYAKAVLDSMNGVLWDDDDQIVDLNVRKLYTDDAPYIYIEVAKATVDTSKSCSVSKVSTPRKRPKRRQSRRLR